MHGADKVQCMSHRVEGTFWSRLACAQSNLPALPRGQVHLRRCLSLSSREPSWLACFGVRVVATLFANVSKQAELDL